MEIRNSEINGKMLKTMEIQNPETYGKVSKIEETQNLEINRKVLDICSGLSFSGFRVFLFSFII
ncbi:hypothetical protein ASJ81_10880 [Methanosarcina spelaei]|jgi:hypothetical protein|uniref:Uncharacterized protein n=1 Tax=Methanosarcina spelaei TaxID=1036679 RepID=A0A2A2HPV8_9EURY|nr:hypothetical protein ASJ81_10880 [Methanosarcina spelaei]